MSTQVASAAVAFMRRIVDETGQTKLRFTLHGGEPLMAGHDLLEGLFGEIAKAFPGNTASIGMQSNLWLLDDRLCELLKDSGVSVGTSLDGPEEVNDRQRGNGSFARTMAGIGKASSAGLEVSCIATFTRDSAEHWEKVFDFFKEQNLPFSLHPAVAYLAGKSGWELEPEQWGKMLCGMLKRYARERHTLRIETLDQLCRTVVEKEGAVCSFRDCFGMFLVVDPEGGIYACQRMVGIERFRLGSIFDNPSMDDLTNSPAAKLLLEREKRIRDECRSCEHIEICKGGCAYNAFAHGTGNKDPLCVAWKGIFDEIHTRLDDEMETMENINLLAEHGLRRTGHPLIHAGAIAELARKDGHPYQTARNARRIVAAVELARNPDIDLVSHKLVALGVSRSEESAKQSFARMQATLNAKGILNKLYIHTTFCCQLHCTHCYAQADSGRDDEMPPEALFRLIEDAADIGFLEVVITGGEPLIHKENGRILRQLADIRKRLESTKLVLRTNFAMPLSHADMEQIAAAFNQVVVSVDGPQELHDQRRGAGSFRRVHDNLETWIKHIAGRSRCSNPAKLNLAASLRSKDARGEVGRSIRAYADSLGIRHVKMRPLLPLGRARDWDEPPTTEVLHMNIEPWEILEHGFHPCASCGIGQNLYVEPDGTAFPCYAYHKPHSYLGNACRDGLKAVIGSAGFQHLSTRTVDTNKRCWVCDMRYICGGACRAWSSDAAQFDLDAPPEYCDPLRERAERIYQEALAYLGLS